VSVLSASCVALYLRVSTEEQAREGFSIPAQRERLLAFAKAQDWTVVEIYSDEGVSGAKIERPSLSRLRIDATAKKFDLVLVWKVDRLSRKVGHLASLVEELDRYGICLRSVTEPFDTSHAAGRAFMQMLGVLAELERENTRERSKMGSRKRVEQGYMHGKPTMLGYKWLDGRIDVHPETAPVVQWIFKQYLSGVGMLRIAQQLIQGVPGLNVDAVYREFRHVSPHSVRDRVSWLLQSPVYAGSVTINGERYPGRHKPLVDLETWNRAQAIIQSRQSLANRAHTSRYLLSGIVVCGSCGAPMYGFRQPNRARNAEAREARPYYEYYVCRNSTNFQGKSATCDNWGIRRETAELKVVETLKAVTVDPDLLDRLAPKRVESPAAALQEERARLLHELETYENRMRRWHEALEKAPDLQEMALTRLRELAEAQRVTTQRLQDLDQAIGTVAPAITREQALDMLRSVAPSLEYLDHDRLRETIRTFVRRVTIRREGYTAGGTAIKNVDVEFYPV